MQQSFKTRLTRLINEYNREKVSNSPDWLLARFMIQCLEAYEQATRDRDEFFNIKLFENIMKGDTDDSN